MAAQSAGRGRTSRPAPRLARDLQKASLRKLQFCKSLHFARMHPYGSKLAGPDRAWSPSDGCSLQWERQKCHGRLGRGVCSTL